MKLHHVYISVKDMNRAIEFYRGFLSQEPAETGERFSVFKTEPAALALYNPAADDEEGTYGDNCVPVFDTENLDERIEWLKKQDVEFIDELTEIDGMRFVQFKDPEGNVIELSTPHD